ncbi:hypothetical protein DSO57_1004740 [Entomophthora muscae]|uniref:Uncharacterized protein n=1 Tax=Entomophthora muscae TaxID=34485 RepID=A0ACC2TJ39_9FUNG|nr:hypothetical protein DSO57_1004740 [Entomophthora muscae]
MWSNKAKISSQNFKLGPLSDTEYLVPPDPPLSEAELLEIINAPIDHAPPKEHRIFDLPSAPAFYPTEKEFKDPASYIASIREEGEKYGICKIIPPKSFRPKSTPRFKDFKFNTRKQEIGTIGISGYYNRLYIFNLRTFHKQIGNHLRFPPIINDSEIDLYELKLVVERQGGYGEVSSRKKWVHVANALDCGLSISGEGPQRLEEKYKIYILPYEKHIANADQFKFSVHNESRCCICKKGGEKIPLMSCKHCKVSAHAGCIKFSHKIMPPEEWLCLSCINARELEFEDGPIYSLAEFGGKAAQLRTRLLENILANNPDVPHVSLSTMSAEEVENVIEKLYWQLVNDIYSDVSVDYGADLTSIEAFGGFPIKGFGPWNLNELPTISASLFAHLKEGISGMTAPWAYIGMVLSTFCWHTEDHYTYSINYHHWGATKTWYGIPASHSATFENSFKRQEPKLFHKHPDLLSHLSFTLCPDALRGVLPVYALDQHPGEYVITFPRAYHAGFNHGLNFNEAANFAPADWLPYGLECLSRYRKHGKSPVFSHHELMLLATTTKDLALAESIIPHIEEASIIEQDHRIRTQNFIPIFKEPADWAVVQCLLCNSYCFFSHIACECTDTHQLIFCLDHAAGLKDCLISKHVLIKTVARPKIVRAVTRLRDAVSMWASWMESYRELQKQVPKLADLEHLVKEANSISKDHPLAVSQFITHFRMCLAWEEKCGKLLTAVRNKNTSGGSIPEDIRVLIHQHQDLNFQSQYADELFALSREIDALRHSAAIIISSPSTTLKQVLDLQERIHNFGVEFQESRQVDYVVKKLQWCQEASNLLSTSLYSPESAEALLSQVPNQTCPQVASLVGSLNKFLHRKPSVALTLSSPSGPILINQEEHGRHLALGKSLLNQAKDSSFENRPPIAELDTLLRYFQGLNSNDALLTNLDYARLQVGVWRNQAHTLLFSRSISVSTLVGYFSSLLATTERAYSMINGSRSCICFQEATSNYVACMVCKVVYHPSCCKHVLISHGHACYICGPIKQLPKTRPRLERADLDEIMSTARMLPFVPDEFLLVEKTSKLCLAIAERISSLIPTSPPLDRIKDHLRLVESLGVRMEIADSLWGIIKSSAPPLSFNPFSVQSLKGDTLPSCEPPQPKRAASPHSPAEHSNCTQPPKRLLSDSGNIISPEVLCAQEPLSHPGLDPKQHTVPRGVAQPKVPSTRQSQALETLAELAPERSSSADKFSSSIFSIESLFLASSTASSASSSKKVIRFDLKAASQPPSQTPAARRPSPPHPALLQGPGTPRVRPAATTPLKPM